MMAVTPLFAVLGGTLMLELAIPVINGLGAIPGKIDPRAAMAFFLIGAVHMALMVLVLKVGATMVGSWTVFGVGGSPGREDRDPAPVPAAAPPVRIEQISHGAYAPSSAPQRRIAVAGATTIAANDSAASQATAAAASHGRVQVIDNSSPALLQASAMRARGIGSRFRSPNNARLTRSLENTR
jgi:type IV secretion system protein VirB6